LAPHSKQYLTASSAGGSAAGCSAAEGAGWRGVGSGEQALGVGPYVVLMGLAAALVKRWKR